MMLLAASIMMACDKEENGSKTVDFAGSYNGYTLASCNYFHNMLSADETVSIIKNTDGTASVSFTSAMWGEFTVSNAQANAGDKICTLSGSGQTQMGMGGSTSSYDCTFTAEIISQTDARMEFSVPAVMGGMTLMFQTGDQNRYTDGESVTLTANGDGTVKVVFESASWGTYAVESASATKEGDEYIFTGSGTVSMGMGDATSDYDFTVSGKTNTAKDDYSITFNVPAVMGGLTVTLLPGTAPAAEE